MEKERTISTTTKPIAFEQIVKEVKKGDKPSMNMVLDLFTNDIEYLSKYIMLPREEAIQILKIELLSIVYDKL